MLEYIGLVTRYTERYRSGHNGADSKSVCGKPHEGSNPSLSARKKASFVYRQKTLFQRNPSFRTSEIHLWRVKSLCGEILLCRVKDGFHFTVRHSRTISLLNKTVRFVILFLGRKRFPITARLQVTAQDAYFLCQHCKSKSEQLITKSQQATERRLYGRFKIHRLNRSLRRKREYAF